MTPSPIRRFATLGGTLVLAGLLAACSVGPGGASSPSAVASEVVSPAPSAAVGTSDCPTSQPEPLPAGETRIVTIDTSQGSMQLTIEADLSPIAAGNFVALAGCGYYDGVVFHRLVPGFVIQGGDPTGTGSGGPGYTITDEPVTATYGRGTVAMARTDAPDSVGSQFFIVLDDEARGPLESFNTYQIIGTVTSGMETADAIAAMPNAGPSSGNAAIDPVAMDSVTVSTP
jgi:peptidyl-prolyl cis-trans isomerase B (cyclophilin B)